MKISVDTIKQSAFRALQAAKKYSLAIFVLFFVAIYGFLGFRIYSLNNATPDPNDVSAQLKTAGVPRIDPDALAKIQKLQDNSVDVQTLFDQARTSPFEE